MGCGNVLFNRYRIGDGKYGSSTGRESDGLFRDGDLNGSGVAHGLNFNREISSPMFTLYQN